MRTMPAVFTAALLLSSVAVGHGSWAQSGARQAQAPPLYAEASLDCAPWDGSAFTVSVQPVAGVKRITPPTLHVSIWQFPNLPQGGRFTFPDLSGKIGAVYLEPSPSESVVNLRGTVSFTSVVQGKIVEGQLDLTDPRGKRYAATFAANWLERRIMCGD